MKIKSMTNYILHSIRFIFILVCGVFKCLIIHELETVIDFFIYSNLSNTVV